MGWQARHGPAGELPGGRMGLVWPAANGARLAGIRQNGRPGDPITRLASRENRLAADEEQSLNGGSVEKRASELLRIATESGQAMARGRR